ncbi:LOB domain-containing protein 29-like [Ananas comosus]|uniref:LOB domain-containing protein 29-like n=2 Tax=Ananas comosus TaxID=4615 RepID=A0A6P5EP00_ANACO|nr:LOB domain-containing protein 29-like [Ananas comosus]CAD1843834.1 unnamed protein product [Ananas comosus var. bracteatus]
MTGFGSPCGACKFLRRKCVKGCVFAPYFCHEQGATHFAAIHKVFGASNVSKLLMHLPVSDRSEAAVTISYEAQARLQDPIYGCVAHIFALQQQVVNLQAQLASLKAQAAQGGHQNGPTNTSTQEYKPFNKASTYQQDGPFLFTNGDGKLTPPFFSNMSIDSTPTYANYYSNGQFESNSAQSSHGNYGVNCDTNEEHTSFGDEDDSWRSSGFHDMEDLQSVAYAYLHRS